ncbi:MAG: MFS transporter [Pirellulaceae bacterium]|nr:MFS transporter [Pirellulaceae bacterium]
MELALPARPTHVRYGVLFALCSLAVLLYIDRVSIGQAATAIRDSLDLKIDQWSWVNNAFILAYCIFEVPTGHWGDRYGSRGVIARIVIWWSLFTMLTGAGFDLWSLIAIRFLFGAGEAGAFPNAARVVTHWFPPAERGLARGAITTTSLLGGALAQPLSAWLVQTIGWRAMFGLYGLLGIVWAAFFYWWFRDDPAQHPACNAAEQKHIGVPECSHEGDHPAIDWLRVILSPNVWLMGAIMVVSATLFYMQFQWYPTYLEEARQISKQLSGNLTGIVIVGGALGALAGGFFSDFLLRRSADRRWSRRLAGFVTLTLSAASLWAVRYCESTVAATLCNAAALFFLQLSIPTWWTVVAEISGRHGAAMWGLMNSLGGLGVFTMTFLVGWVVRNREQAGLEKLEIWRPVFDGVALALAFGACCWLLVDATRPIFRPHEPQLKNK